MGDNDGNISIWPLSDKQISDQPFAFIKNNSSATDELIEVLISING
jgi:hypothetical protein